MDLTQRRLDEIRKLAAKAKGVFSQHYDERESALAAEKYLESRAPQDIPFLLRLLDEANADKQRLIDGISTFYDGSIQDGALGDLLEEVGVNEAKCSDHNPVQHRDGKPPWCRKCGLTKDFKKPTGIFDRRKD